MKPLLVAVLLGALPLAAWSKLPPPTPQAQAKAEEAKAKTAEASQREAQLLARYQDRVAENWAAHAKARGLPFNPVPVGATQAALPASGTVVTADKTIPRPAEAAATSERANAQPAQAGGLSGDAAGAPAARP